MSESDFETSQKRGTDHSRRNFLALLTASTSLIGFSGGSRAIQDRKSANNDTTRDDVSKVDQSDIPPYPDDPFIQPSFGIPYILGWENHGWEDVSDKMLMETVLNFHPDVLAFDQLLKYENGQIDLSFPGGSYLEQFGLAQDLELPATSGMNVHIETNEEKANSRYGPIEEESEWELPDGTPVESPLDILAETYTGEPQQTSYSFETLGTPSVFAPGGLELIINATINQLERGYSGFLIDGVGVFRLHGLDFSRWAQANFRTHLDSLSNGRLSALGIDSPQSFDVREYLQANDLTPDNDIDPREDPVFREYLLHQHIGIDRWFEDYREQIVEAFPERMENGDIAIYANQFTGNLRNPQAPNIYISDSMDMIYTELFPTVSPPVDVNYKIMRSVGDFSKPVIAKGTLGPVSQEQLGGIDAATSNVMFKRFQVAEAYSSGARFQMPLTNRMGYSEEDTITNWVSGDGTVAEELSSFLDFLWSHKRFLTDLEPAGDIALIWSLPTHVWRREPTWNIGGFGGAPEIDSFTGTASILREAGYTYDVLTFGHPRLWDDSIQLNQLDEYDMVILAGVRSISNEQVSALQTYLDNDGEVLCTDSIPDRDAMFEPRDDVATIFERDNATVLDGSPGRQRESNGESDGSLLDALEDSTVEPTRQTEYPSVAVHSHYQPDPDRYIVPLMNYNYDAETDSFSTVSDIQLRLPAMGSTETVVRYYRPQRQEELQVNENGNNRSVEVPELVEWGIVVVTDSEEKFTEGSPETARARVDETTQKLEDVKDLGYEELDGFIIAKSKLDAAESALNYNSFKQASKAADEAMKALQPLISDNTSTETTAKEQESGPNTKTEESTSASSTTTETPGLSFFSGIVAFVIASWELIKRSEEAE